jgi:DNA-directed RNA polymerase specialized sigma24 family protein
MESKPPPDSVSIDVVAQSPAPALLREQSDWKDTAARMKRGDQGALGELYDGTSALLYGMMLRMLGDSEVAQAALIEVYSRAWGRINTFDPERSGLLAWLILLARGVALERPDRPRRSMEKSEGDSDRQIVERAFFDGVKDEDLRGAMTRLRGEKGESA